jgi:putative protease
LLIAVLEFKAFLKVFVLLYIGWFCLVEKPIGTVAHFYDKISVAVIELNAPLKVGEKIRFKRGEEEFSQPVNSMQIEHEQIKAAKKGQAIGMKTMQPVHEGAEVFKVTE